MDLYQQQLELEAEATNEGILRGIQRLQDAFANGRGADTGVGKRIFLKAYQEALPLIEEALNRKGKGRGSGSKYYSMLRRCDPRILTIITLRHCIGACAKPEPTLMQDLLRDIGAAIEAEILIDRMTDVSPWYVDKIDTQVKNENSHSLHNITRKYRTGAEDIGLAVETWSVDEKVGTANTLLALVLELGLFQLEHLPSGKGRPYNIIAPTPELAQYLTEAANTVNAQMHFPPMLVPPRPWTSYYSGGYLTDDLAVHAPMMSIRSMKRVLRKWVVEHLREGCAQEAKDAANKAQSVPYRVNRKVLAVASTAMHNPKGILGLPPHGKKPQPEFPFDTDSFNKETATPEELELFKEWKGKMKVWYTNEKKRYGKKLGIASKLKIMRDFQKYSELYFPTFFDWRGRLYFRSALNPQGHDTVKGCLDLAVGKRLGARGLFWLKVQVATCCGFDKHDFSIRAKWCDENWHIIQQFLNDPLNITPPEKDSSFTLLQAGYALQEALDMQNPEDYICHVPCAMDATCSGLQHFSAMFRDEVGGLFTNLIDNGEDQKSDIYRSVAAVAAEHASDGEDAPVVLDYWKDKSITRNMAKKPVMTFVYGSTMQSTMESVSQDMDDEGYTRLPEYSLVRLCVPVAKALRHGVEQTVPKSAEGMKYLQTLVRKSNRPLKWFTPVGIPVLNWSECAEVKTITLRSMNVCAMIVRTHNGEYDKVGAVNGISPNWTHSLDSAHLCKTINAFDGHIIPIHDSFATHMCDVDEMHVALRETFVDMYSSDVIELLLTNNTFNEEVARPANGKLELHDVKESRYMFC